MSDFSAQDWAEKALFTFAGLAVAIVFVCLAISIISDGDKNEETIRYRVVDVINHKKPGEHEATYYKVLINNHDYTKVETTMHNNIIFKHNDDCAHCKKRGINRRTRDSFSTKDGTTIEMHEKLNKMKEKK